jgi:hypothetical protein
MSDQRHHDTTKKKHNENSGFNPDIKTVIDLVSEHHRITAQIKDELVKAQDQLNQLRCFKQQAKALHHEATQFLDEIHTTLWPFLGEDDHE